MTTAISSKRALWMACRPPTLLVGLGPVVLGLGFGFSRLLEQGSQLTAYHIWAAAAALLMVLLLQTAANLVNDAKDAERGVDTRERVGPVRVVQSGLLSRRVVRLAYTSCFSLAALIILSLFLWTGDYLVISMAVVCCLAAFAYTAGPFPLSYYALGELTALIFFGPIAVMGSAYLILQRVDWTFAFWGLGTGMIAAAIMSINNYRDMAGDRKAGKNTLATVFGHRFGSLLPEILLFGSLALFFGFATTQKMVGAGSIGLVVGGFHILYRIRPALKGHGPKLNLALKRSAQFSMLYAAFFACCVLLSEG